MRQTDRQTDGQTDGLMPHYRREGHINNQCLLPGVFFYCQGQATVWRKFQREVQLFLEVPNFLMTV